MKSGLLAFGALIWAAPVIAQPSRDPLAPMPTSAQPNQSPATTLQTLPRAQAASPTPNVPIPRDWRGVFDAIDAGNWASAQAGITALPPSILTPVAKAELRYIAKKRAEQAAAK